MVWVNPGDSLLVALENIDYLFAGNINDFDRAIITGSHKLAIIIKKRQLPQQLMMRLQISNFILISNTINDVEVSIVISCSQKIDIISLCNRCDEDVPEIAFASSFF